MENKKNKEDNYPTPVGRSILVEVPEYINELSEIEDKDKREFKVLKTNNCLQVQEGDIVEFRGNATPCIVCDKKYLVFSEHDVAIILNR